MVVVPKPDGEVRICVDYFHLNEAIKRERLMVPSVNEVLSQVRGANYFSKIDCRSGYFQIPLERGLREVTTFITPFGRYFFNRLPMGIASAPEVYHRKMTEILAGLDGVVTLLDDSLITGRTEKEHDARLEAVLKRLNEYGVTLNETKCQFKVRETKFLGYKLSTKGIEPDTEKVKAVLDLPTPANTTEIRRFLGMVNYYIKFLPRLAQLSQPLRDLLKKCNIWVWGPKQEESFETIKRALTRAPILGYYETNKNTRIAADTSLAGIGAVLEQQGDEGHWKPVQFASRSLSEAEKRYSNIEREALGITWACERMREFLIGTTFTIQTDHKPLLTLFGKKPMNELTPRIQRFRMKMANFSYKMQHVAGKRFFTPDTLSRAPIAGMTENMDILSEEMEEFKNIRAIYRVEDPVITKIEKGQRKDTMITGIKQFVHQGWPVKECPNTKQFFKFRGDLWVKNEMLMFRDRMVIPADLKKDMLHRIHEGHGGERRCFKRARMTVWWPGIQQDIRHYVEKCPQCIEGRIQKSEPLMPSPLPEGPWEVVAVDYFKKDGRWFIVIADYYSRYLDVKELNTLTSQGTIKYLKEIFSKFGIPKVIRCDNGTNLVSRSMECFAREMGFRIISSSPRYPQSNGFAEAMVKVGKKLLQGDLQRGLLAYRTTPLDLGPSPGELLLGRRLRSTLPMNEEKLAPSWPDLRVFKAVDAERKRKMEDWYNQRHRAKTLPQLQVGDKVWVGDKRSYAEVTGKCSERPRSYQVRTPGGAIITRNRRNLNRA